MARIGQQELEQHIEENENEIARLQVTLSEESRIREMMELSIKMIAEMGNEWDETSSEDKQGFTQSLFSEIIFDLDTHRITGFKLKPWVEPFLQVHVSTQACLEGFEPITAPLPTTKESMQHFLSLLYSEQPAEWQTWEKRERNAEIYRRYLAGEDSVMLAQAFGLSDRRVRSIIERERKRGGDNLLGR